MSDELENLRSEVPADDHVTEEEVDRIRETIYADDVIDREEANFLFDLNDAVTGEDNADSWSELFVEAISSHVLDDEDSPGAVDEDEAQWLIDAIEGDDTYDDTEKALLAHIEDEAEELAGELEFKLDLFQID